jgi:hypothetical protein
MRVEARAAASLLKNPERLEFIHFLEWNMQPAGARYILKHKTIAEQLAVRFSGKI